MSSKYIHSNIVLRHFKQTFCQLIIILFCKVVAPSCSMVAVMTATVFSASIQVNMALRSSLFGFKHEVYKWVSSLKIHESVFHLQPRLDQIAMGQSPNFSLGQRKQEGQAQPVPDSRHLPLSKFSSLYIEIECKCVTDETLFCYIYLCNKLATLLPGRLSRVTMICLTRGTHKSRESWLNA